MNRTKNSRPARQRWQKTINEQRESGMSVAAFCRKRSVPEAGFYVWRKKLLNGEPGGRGFIHLSETSCEEKVIEVRTPNGYTVKMSSVMEAGRLRALLEILRAI